jgi:predicted nucleic acid-binding protein
LESLSFYLDTSVIVPLFIRDLFVDDARSFIRDNPEDLIVSDLASVEFASVVGIRVRTRDLTHAEARAAFANFDQWTRQKAIVANVEGGDFETAVGYLRSLAVTLRAPDALHLSIARRLGAGIATFDKPLGKAARTLGINVAKHNRQ